MQFIYAGLTPESCECLLEPPEVKNYETDYWRSNLLIFALLILLQLLLGCYGYLKQIQHMQEVTPTSSDDGLVEMHLKDYLETAEA